MGPPSDGSARDLPAAPPTTAPPLTEESDRDQSPTGRHGSPALVIIPTYNERENIERAVAGVRNLGHHVLVVDDGSPDGTAQVVERMAARDAGLSLLRRGAKLGLGTAYLAGFKLGLERGYEFFVEMDADGSHLPEHLDNVVEAARACGGMAIGSRYVPGGSIVGWGPKRWVLSYGANLYCRLLLGVAARDVTSGYRCYTRAVLESIGLDTVSAEGYSFQIEMAYRCVLLGFPLVEVPIRFEDRVAGQSKVSAGEIHRALLTVVRLRLNHPRVSRRRLGNPAARQLR